MNLYFQKVILHNFLSYAHSEIDLTDRQYCLVSGKNYCKLDNALSNGAGKSTFSSAICFALTGATIQNISKNLKNNLIDEKLAYVELTFKVDKDTYVITRYIEPKSDLRIILNGNDISGKGIRESEAVLKEHIPDLTTDLISSIIILGQGLPSKFSGNSPSGRKEVLERLSKSDFMIDDIKNRITKRSIELNEEKRKYEDAILKAESEKSVYQKQLEQVTLEYEELNKPHDYEKTIDELNKIISSLKEVIDNHNKKINENNIKNDLENQNYTKLLENKNNDILNENNAFNDIKTQYNDKKATYNSKVTILNEKITRLKSIKDICPTCGQKIPGVIKPDTSEDEAALQAIKQDFEVIDSKYNGFTKEHSKRLFDIENDYSKEISDVSFRIKKIKEDTALYTSDLKIKNDELIKNESLLQKTLFEKENYEKELKKAQETLYNLNLSISTLNESVLYNNNERDNILNHISVLNQINTLVKRDFRGFLLSNVIAYINSKAKQYCEKLFGSNQLEFILDGNNIDITYCDKDYFNLSGGEKQKVDIIVQFAIRDMMQQYLGFSSNILVLDEVFDNLDAVATDAVVNLISNELNDIESIFIISHHADELRLPIDTELEVVKDENGISSIR